MPQASVSHGVQAPSLLLEGKMIDQNLNQFYNNDMHNTYAIAKPKPLGLAKSHIFKDNAIALAISNFKQGPNHKYFAYDPQRQSGLLCPKMIRFDDCIVCGTKMIDASCLVDITGEQFLTYGMCPSCGHFQHTVRPPKSFYETFYAAMWDPARQDNKVWPNQIPENVQHYIQVFQYLPRGARVLEFGAGWGDSLLAFKNRGHHCFGVEASEHRKRFCEERIGLSMFQGMIEDVPIGAAPFLEESFDLVYSNHVLEHVYNPRQVLQHLRPLLKDNGLLYLALPNYYSENLTKNTHELSHSCSFSKENILLLLNEIGFDFVKQTGDELNVGYIVRKSRPQSQDMLQEKLAWMKTFMPHRGLAHILEKNGLAQIPKVVEQDIDVSIDWHFVASGKPPETYLALDYTFYTEYSPVLNRIKEVIRGRSDISEIQDIFPIEYVYPTQGVPICYY